MSRYRSLGVPLLLIALGLVALLANLGAISWDQVVRVLDLWPLLLIVIGVELIVRRLAAPPMAAGLGAVVAIIAVVAAVAYIAAGPGIQVGTQSGVASAPAGQAERGSLVLNGGAARVTARIADTGANLYQATYSVPPGDRPSFHSDNGEVTVVMGSGRRFFVGPSATRRVDLVLSDKVSWAITLSGGAFNIDADLSAGQVRSVSVQGGASSINVRLPRPQGTVPIAFQGGAINATLHRPVGTEVRVSVHGGVSSINADGHSVNGFGGDSTWTSPGYDSATDRYDVSAEGGANHVTLDSY